jgi:hypothetical protein
MSKMDVSEKFELKIPKCLVKLEGNDSAFVEARERLVSELSAVEAFDSITNVMLLSLKQDDPYIFASCCWLVMSLARISNTTEMPDGLSIAINKAYEHGQSLTDNAVSEVEVIACWYRHDLPYNKSFKRTKNSWLGSLHSLF